VTAPVVAPRRVHFVGICGAAVSGAALLAQQLGYRVSGSDEGAVPPTTDMLTRAGIPWVNRFDAANLDHNGVPDLVVVANTVRTGNPEWQAATARGLAVTSEAELYAELTRDRLRIAVCGTHGKTTTAALLAWMLDQAGLQPGFRLGAVSRDFGESARLGAGAPFVFEGDEYTTAPWDSRPKFLHVRPQLACVTRMELDHPDVYPDFDAYQAPFIELARAMPEDGLLALGTQDEAVVALAAAASCPTVLYGEDVRAGWRIEAGATGDGGGVPQRFTVHRPDAPPLQVAMSAPGAHHRHDATAALLLAAAAGADVERCAAACGSFVGAARRWQVVGSAAGVSVVDDHTDHPTEVAVTLSAAREQRRGGRILAVFTPHTYSRTLRLLDAYEHCFDAADVVVLGPLDPARERDQPALVSSEDVAARVRRGGAGEVHVVADAAAAALMASRRARSGDLVLCLSVNGFDGVAQRVLAALEGGDGR